MTKLGKEEHLLRRGLGARMFHAVFFEITAIVFSTVFLIFIMHQSIWSMGVLAIIISLIATAWNGVFNFIFDRLQKKYQFSRTRNIRILHALGFEGGLVLFTVPTVAYYLSISFKAAFFIEIWLILFFLPYSIIFNFIYDKIYIYFSEKRSNKRKQSKLL